MDAMPQLPFDTDDLFLNPDRRCPCVLLLDRSYSMSGQKIAELNAGLKTFVRDLSSDIVAIKRVELAIVSFGPVHVEQSFATVDRCNVPNLSADNDTPMGAAIEKGLSLLEDRKQTYKASGVPYFRPWVFLITDGAATDDLKAAQSAIAAGERADKFCFFAVGVEGADFGELKTLAKRAPLKLKGIDYSKLFLWLSGSLKDASRSTPGTPIAPENPTGPSGWAEMPT